MKGVVFVLFEEFIIDGWGEETFEDLLDLCPHVASTPIVGPKTYPDEWLIDMLTAACGRLGVSAPDALRAFGRFALPGLIGRFPNFLEGAGHPRALLLQLHDIIHVEVRKLLEGASPPDFRYEDPGDGGLIMHYHSRRRLCHFMEGLLDGLGDHFNVPTRHRQLACTHDGAEHCTFSISFGDAR